LSQLIFQTFTFCETWEAIVANEGVVLYALEMGASPDVVEASEAEWLLQSPPVHQSDLRSSTNTALIHRLQCNNQKRINYDFYFAFITYRPHIRILQAIRSVEHLPRPDSIYGRLTKCSILKLCTATQQLEMIKITSRRTP